MAAQGHNALKCFIAAEHSAERSLLRKQLEGRGVSCYTIDRGPSSGSPAASIVSFIQESDFIVGVFSRPSSANIAYEIGMAVGMGKPLLLFGDELSSVPSDLASFNLVKIGTLDPPSWSPYLDTFLRTIPSRQPVEKKSSSTNSARRWREIRADLHKIMASEVAYPELEFEKLLERAFKRANFPVSSSPGADFGADFAIASPGLVKRFGLPILVEAKLAVKAPLSRVTMLQLAGLIQARQGGAGLFVTASETRMTDLAANLNVPIAVMTATVLIDWLEGGVFEPKFVELVKGFWAEER